MHILLTNDDGIRAVGLRALYAEMVRSGHRVSVVAPMTEQSAVGHSVTFLTPLRVKEVVETGFEGKGVFGTPVDCVKLALTTLLDSPPDLILSGINNGANVGVDILYSGTVSAATEGALAGFPALAVSIDTFDPQDLGEQAVFVRKFIDRGAWKHAPEKCVLNLNFPRISIEDCKGLRVCAQTGAVYRDGYEVREDPRGRPYYWLQGEIPPEDVAPGTDRELLTQGYITLTPLVFDFTHWKFLQDLTEIVARG
ncbi:MAG: 5'/3'-nucleotidase SurE [Desulfoplanes sp.]|nr:5'/3'-nucleotidase SurE [Desulfoplanes sp.]MDD4649122.1 5'/3'-nucleotidase SurE [Desulfoplanes sp.]